MKAVMLAAGVGRRLYGDDDSQPPKALLRFAGQSLLHRNIEVLRDHGVEELVLVVGYRKEEIEAEVDVLGARDFVRTLYNPRFGEGPVISLWTARHVLAEGDDVLFMDADVLYHPALIGRLVASTFANCFLLDRHLELGEDPVRLCLRDGVPVDFGKMIEGDFDVVGEWPGFARFSASIAARLTAATQAYMDDGRTDAFYEEAMRDVLVSAPPGTFGFVDITGVPWIEIDYPSDLLSAETIIMPRLSAIGDSPFDDEVDLAAGRASGEKS